MGRKNNADPTTPRRPPQVVVSEEVHRFLRLRAAEENVSIGRVVERLVMGEQARLMVSEEKAA